MTLKELGWIYFISLILQILAVALLSYNLIIFLLIVWFFAFLMNYEFFCSRYLKKRPLAYLFSHMCIIPLIDLFATACQWSISESFPSVHLAWFLIAGFFNGCVFEVGRKIREPKAEQEGVDTYSKLYGVKKALFMWWGFMLLAFISAILAAINIGTSFFVFVVCGLCLLISILVVWNPVVSNQPNLAKVELFSGLWVLILYISLSLIHI